jgi:small-conductance mechanosensitive channel
MFQVANHVSQASRLAILVYLVDCLTIILTGLGFATTLSHRHPHTNLSTCFAKILYIVWAAQRLSVFKRYLLGRVIHNKTARQGKQQQHNTAPAAGATVLTTSAGNSTKAISRNGYSVHGNFNSLHHRHHNNNKSSSAMPGRNTAAMSPKTLGQAAIIDKVVDGIIYVVTGLFLLDILNVEMGVGVSSIFAFGSAGTLVMGLASRDVASMFVSGLTLTTTDHVREGDHVKFGDGTTGQILRIGWMHTTIRGYDELVEVVCFL